MFDNAQSGAREAVRIIHQGLVRSGPHAKCQVAEFRVRLAQTVLAMALGAPGNAVSSLPGKICRADIDSVMNGFVGAVGAIGVEGHLG